MTIIHFLIGKRQLPLFPICLSRHRCEIRRGICRFLVYHRCPNIRSLNRALFCIFLGTSSESVRPLGIMPVCSVFSLEVSGIYTFTHLVYNMVYWQNSLPRVLCTVYCVLPASRGSMEVWKYRCTIVARDCWL